MIRWGRFKHPSCAHARLEDTWAIWTKDLFILGAAVPGEALETMVELCFWPSIVLVCKLAIYCDYIWYILRTTDFYDLGLQKREKTLSPLLIPSKSHGVAVFIAFLDSPWLFEYVYAFKFYLNIIFDQLIELCRFPKFQHLRTGALKTWQFWHSCWCWYSFYIVVLS